MHSITVCPVHLVSASRTRPRDLKCSIFGTPWIQIQSLLYFHALEITDVKKMYILKMKYKSVYLYV